jgi:uncharacterized membrane protein YgcG
MFNFIRRWFSKRNTTNRGLSSTENIFLVTGTNVDTVPLQEEQFEGGGGEFGGAGSDGNWDNSGDGGSDSDGGGGGDD